jgi:hypothetical protein
LAAVRLATSAGHRRFSRRRNALAPLKGGPVHRLPLYRVDPVRGETRA